MQAIRVCPWPHSAVLLLVALAVSAYTPPPLLRNDVNIQPESVCKTCHLDISEQWEQSAHSRSDANRNLLWGRMYLYSLKQTRGKTFLACSPCHQPVTFLLQDFENIRSVSSEGVDCSYCHSIAGPGKPEGIPPFELDLAKFQSTIRNPVPTKAHGEAYSPYMATSEYCGGCHDYENQNGVRIGTTLLEWKRTKYAKQGITCQRCHMPGGSGRNSYLGPVRPRVADHSFDREALAASRSGAVTLKLRSERGGGDTLRVYATATNAGWGHSLPTGNDQKMALVRLRVLGPKGDIVWENDPFQEWQASIFALILADELGNWPAETWNATSIVSDHRIKAGESAVVRYSVPLGDAKGPFQLEAQLLLRRARPSTLQAYGLSEDVYGAERELARATATAP